MRQSIAILCAILLLTPTSLLMAQEPATLLSSDQLDNLVAPIALYPDELLAQVLAACTYPLELVEAQQWLQQNRALVGASRLDAAKQQNWDPSVAALVAFPNVLSLLNRDIRWTTDLGNTFLAQQADVMNAIQRMRSRAQSNGRLASTPEQRVTDNQGAIEVQPANPQVIYVPSYNPEYVWGPPSEGAYPSVDYGGGSGFDPGVLIGAIFSGLLNFGGWGWGLNWLTHALFLNNLFFGHFGFGGLGGLGGGTGGGLGATAVWAHNPGHRLGVAYPNHALSARFASAHSYAGFSNARAYSGLNTRTSIATPRSYQSYNRSVDGSRYNSPVAGYRSSSSWQQSSSRGLSGSRYNSPAAGYRSSPSWQQSYNRSVSSNRYNSPARSYRSPSVRAPKMSSHNSAPRAPRMKAPKGHSSGHSSHGHSGKHR